MSEPARPASPDAPSPEAFGEVIDPDRSGLADVGNGIELFYETFGDPDDPPLLLVMGLGVQMLGWHERFCRALADEGHHVIRFDNRDVGASTKVRGKPRLGAAMLGIGSPPYDLGDMAADTVGLLDHLEVEAAHLVGASMGGMIAQTVAAGQGRRVLSLCSIMSSPGGRNPRFTPKPRALATLFKRPPRDREAFSRHFAEIFATIGSPDYPADPDRLRERSLLSYDRGLHPAGAGRHLMAAMASGNRAAELEMISCPTLVIHGDSDPLIPPAAGRATAAAIPGARLELIEGMGHDLPPELWPRFIELIIENAARAKA